MRMCQSKPVIYSVLSFALLSSFLFFLDTSVLADEMDDLLDLSIEELMDIKITSASRKLESVSEAPATVYVITRKDIVQRGYATLADVLRDVPGLETIENYFSEMGTQVPVRGVLGNNKIILLVNGVRINPPGGEEVMIRSDISVRMAEQIEIIYGPGSTLYGQDAISAVINIKTLQPGKSEHAEVLGAYGTDDQTEAFLGFSERIELSEGGKGGVDTSGYIHYFDNDLSDFGDDYPEWWSNYASVMEATGRETTPKRWDKGLNALLRLEKDNNSIQVFYRKSSRSSSEGGYTPILQYVDEAEWEDESIVVEGKNKFEFSDNVSLESILTYNRYEIDPDTRYVFPVSDTELFLNDYKYGLGHGTSLEEKLDIKISEKFYVTTGVKVTYADVIPKSTVPGGADTDGSVVSQGGNFEYYTVAGDPSSLVTVPRVTNLTYHDYGAFLEGHYTLNKEWSVVGGARVDASSRYEDEPFSPRLAVIYDNKDLNFNIKYIFTKAYVAPAPYFGYNVYDNGVAINTANHDLQPERARSNEISAGWQIDKWTLGAAAYYSEQENLLLVGDLLLDSNIIDDEIYVSLDGSQTRLLTHTANGGESETKGIDIFTRYSSDQISLWASYSYVDFESKIGGITKGLPGLSQHNIRLGVSWIPIEDVVITPSLVYRDTPKNISNTYGLDSELNNPYEINLHLLYSPIERVDLFVMIRNLTDNEYALRGVLGPIPQETFRVKGGLRYRF